MVADRWTVNVWRKIPFFFSLLAQFDRINFYRNEPVDDRRCMNTTAPHEPHTAYTVRMKDQGNMIFSARSVCAIAAVHIAYNKILNRKMQLDYVTHARVRVHHIVWSSEANALIGNSKYFQFLCHIDASHACAN